MKHTARGWIITLLAVMAASAPFVAGIVLAQSGENLPTFGGRILQTATTPVNGTNEIQTILLSGTPTGGTFTVTVEGNRTGAITWSATTATLLANVDGALEALTAVGTSGVTTGTSGAVASGTGTLTVTFTGDNVAKRNVGAMTAASSLTGALAAITIATTTPGVEADGRLAPKGSLLIDIGTPDLYINDTAPPNPTWTKVSP